MNSLQTDGETANQKDLLHRHSFDLHVFSRYLELLVARVKVRLKEVEHGCDIQALYLNADGSFSYKFGLLLPDENGLDTTTTEIHYGLHDAFRSANSSSRYIGFRGCGRIPVAPLLHAGLMYSTYGYGIFKDGEHLPGPCALVEAEYGNAIRKVRTDAPTGLTRNLQR